MRRFFMALPLVLVSTATARADEGMWTLDNFPSKTVQTKYGFEPTAAWLDKVRLASIRLAQGCSGSFVSASGLVMTNHHCAHECIEQISTKQKDYVARGFIAKTETDEVKCPALEVNQLVAISDVTTRMAAATKDKTGKDYADSQKAEKAKIEKECAESDLVRCDVVSLYHGGQYHLYKSKRYQDVRLVFAPELAIAFFGGDPDNFMFPRYDLDVSFVRVYENGKPATTNNYFPFARTPTQEGDLTFVSGHPGRTSRDLTVSQLAYERDVSLPMRLLRLTEYRGVLTEYARRGKEEERVSKSTLFYAENSYKALKGMHKALLDESIFQGKVKAENDFRAKVAANPKVKAAVGAAWDEIAKAMAQKRQIVERSTMLERGWGFDSDSFAHARMLVRAADELPLSNEKRLREYSDAALPALKQELFSPAPIYPDFETLRLTFALTKLREVLGADDPVVKTVLGKKAPRTLAAELVKGTKLRDPKVRQKIFEGGKSAIDASQDPMILFAKLVDAEARALRKKMEEEIDSVLDKNGEAVAKARFATYGTSVYPDATFTLRLSYGSVEGYDQNGKRIAPITQMAGAFDRHTGEEPFKLPDTWLKAKDKITATTSFNIATSNDIIGGNSGSPVVNKNGEVVGLIFDGNIQSLGGEYGFDPKMNRAVAVHTAAILEALEDIYGAKRIAEELRGGAPQG